MKSIKLRKGSEYYYPYPYFPIGYIYLSTSNVNPSTYFGGTWERIQGRFLLCANDSVAAYNAGKTGGSENVTLTTDQIPVHAHGLNSHKHSVGAHAHGLNSHTHSFSGNTGNRVTPVNSTNSTFGNGIGWKGGHNGNIAYANSQNTYCQNGWGDFNGEHRHSFSGTTGAASGNTANSTAFNSGAASGNTTNSGGGKAHTNMPPFLAIYAWKRTK